MKPLKEHYVPETSDIYVCEAINCHGVADWRYRKDLYNSLDELWLCDDCYQALPTEYDVAKADVIKRQRDRALALSEEVIRERDEIRDELLVVKRQRDRALAQLAQIRRVLS